MVSNAVRDGTSLVPDLLPDLTMRDVTKKLNAVKGKQTTANAGLGL